MSSREATSRALRPIRSPRCPAMIPPRGRAITPTASVAKDATMPPSSVAMGKNWTLKTSAAAVP